jgi:hypothetical protein
MLSISAQIFCETVHLIKARITNRVKIESGINILLVQIKVICLLLRTGHFAFRKDK